MFRSVLISFGRQYGSRVINGVQTQARNKCCEPRWSFLEKQPKTRAAVRKNVDRVVELAQEMINMHQDKLRTLINRLPSEFQQVLVHEVLIARQLPLISASRTRQEKLVGKIIRRQLSEDEQLELFAEMEAINRDLHPVMGQHSENLVNLYQAGVMEADTQLTSKIIELGIKLGQDKQRFMQEIRVARYDMKVTPGKQELVNKLVSPLLDAKGDLEDYEIDIPMQKLPETVKNLRKTIKKLIHRGIDRGLITEVTLDDLKAKQMIRKAQVLAKTKYQEDILQE